MNGRGSARALVLLGLVSVAFLAGFLCVLPSSAYLHPGTHDGFVAGQALDHLAWIAAEPHHLGTEENAKVRGRLVEELRALGLEPELQSKQIDVSDLGAHWLEEDPAHAESEAAEGGDPPDAVATPDSEGTDEASAEDEPEATVELVNVLVRIEGTGEDGAALLMAHYDSRPGAPGAGDDGAAVASLLVVLREFVIAGVPPRNDVIVLFDDGEEFGLLGAELFAEEHPWMEDVRAVFNFEARGNGGPTILFETGADSGAWVEAFARSAPKPVGTSLAPAVYRRLPNDTSFSVFRDRGVPGLNFAFVGGASAYHRPFDTPQNLRLDTLQHQGEAVRTCLRLAAETDLVTHAALPDPIFFNLPGLGLVRMGRGANLAVGALAILLALAALRGRRPDIVGSLQLTLSIVVGVWAVWWIVWFPVGWLVTVLRWTGLVGEADGGGNLTSSQLCSLALASLGVAVAAGALGGRRARAASPEEAEHSLGDLAAGGLVGGILLTALFLLALPGGSYLAIWPLLFAAIGLLAGRPMIAALLAIPGGVVAMPAVHLLFLTTSIRMWRGTLVEALLIGVGLGFFVLPLAALATPRTVRLLTAGGLGTLVVAAWMAACGS